MSRGGICTLYRSLARQLADLGASVTMITQEPPHPLQAKDVTVVSLPRTEDLVQHREAVADAVKAVRGLRRRRLVTLAVGARRWWYQVR
ncbi:hypothetical protein [Micromonospora zamorensis]|uniref:Glycosyltransferase subfamily 4-like N-terminal domain-containing protein n=1 Tax=Micromonospora zamorensis TaxID=709883 RepID=A0ABZ1PIW1_9ACTN